MAYRLLPEEQSPSTSTGEVLETVARSPWVASAGPVAAVRGTAGNLFSGINSLIAAPLTESITGKKSVPYEETAVGKIFPTSRTSLKQLQEDFPSLKPRNKAEEAIQGITLDAADVFAPGKLLGMGRYAFSPGRSLGMSLASNAGGEFTEQFTGDKGKGEAVKNGMMLGLSLFNPTSANKIAGGLYNQANSLLPKGATVDTMRLERGLTSLENSILGGRPLSSASPSEKWVIDQINKVRQLTDMGVAEVDQLVKQKRSLNEELQKFVYDTQDKTARTQTRNLATKINGELRETFKEYGKTNPDWWKFQSEGDKAYGAIAQSNFVSRALEKFMKGRPEALAHMFGVGLPAGLSFFSGPVGAATAAAYQSAKLITRMIKSPDLRKHYAKVVGAAMADNPKLINGELDRLEKELESSEKEHRYRLLPQE